MDLFMDMYIDIFMNMCQSRYVEADDEVRFGPLYIS